MTACSRYQVSTAQVPGTSQSRIRMHLKSKDIYVDMHGHVMNIQFTTSARQ